MNSPSFSFRFALFLSFSLTACSSFPQIPFFSKRVVPSSSSTPKATPSDLLSLLGSKPQSLAVDPLVARDLISCFKFLVPFTPNAVETEPRHRKLGFTKLTGPNRREKEDDLIWWPPDPVLELARIAVDSGGDPDAIHRLLDPTVIPVPDVEGTNEDRCQLTRTPFGRLFISEELNMYMKFLFEMIVARGPSVGLDVALNRFDLFHGHLFLAVDTGRLGILFHAREYPAYDKEAFPYNMGFCQRGSNVTYDETMNLRNILWLAPLPGDSAKSWAAPDLMQTQVSEEKPLAKQYVSFSWLQRLTQLAHHRTTNKCALPHLWPMMFAFFIGYCSARLDANTSVLAVLDAHPDGIIYRDLIPDYVKFARTIYEDDLGEVAVDVNYLNVGSETPKYQIFIC